MVSNGNEDQNFEENQYTLRSEFARRSSPFASVEQDATDQNQNANLNNTVISQSQKVLNKEEIGRRNNVLQNARRCIANSSRCEMTATPPVGISSDQILHRDMSKETIKKTQSSIGDNDDEEMDENQNNLTQDAFQDSKLGEPPQGDMSIQISKNELMSFLNDGGHLMAKKGRTDQQHNASVVIMQPKQQLESIQTEDLHESYLTKTFQEQSSTENLHRAAHHQQQFQTQESVATLMNNQLDRAESFIRIEQNNSKHACPSDLSQTALGAPLLRSLTPIVSNKLVNLPELSNERGNDRDNIQSSLIDRETDKNVFEADDASLSPEALEADFAEMQAKRGINLNGSDSLAISQTHDVSIIEQRSQLLYETGEQSDAIKSIITSSQACVSRPGDDSQQSKANDQSSNQIKAPPNSEQVTTIITRTDDKEQATTDASYQETMPTVVKITTKVEDYTNILNTQLEQQEPKILENLQFISTEEKHKKLIVDENNTAASVSGTSAAAVEDIVQESEVKQKIALKYDRIELEHKLAEMTKTINNFMTSYEDQPVVVVVPSPYSGAKSSRERHENKLENVKSQRSAQSHKSSLSRSPPKQIKPRAGKPRALKIMQKNDQKQTQNQSITAAGIEETLFSEEDDQTLIISDDDLNHDGPTRVEQTFRPDRLGKAENQMQRQQRRKQKDDSLPLQQQERSNTRLDSKGARIQPYQPDGRDYAEELEQRSREEVRKARQRESGGERHAHFSQPPLQTQDRSPAQRQEEQAPKPQALPKLLAHDTGLIDGRYFAAMSPMADSAALLSGRTGQLSSRIDQNGNLISCLRSGKPRRNKNPNSARDTDTFFSPRGGDAAAYDDGKNNFKDILSPMTNVSSRFMPHNQDYMSPPRDQMILHQANDNNAAQSKNTGELSQHVKFKKQNKNYSHERDKRSRVCNIAGFDLVKKTMHTSRSGAPLSTDRFRLSKERENMQLQQPQVLSGTQNTASNGGGQQNLHNTQRSMGIESYFQNQEKDKPRTQNNRIYVAEAPTTSEQPVDVSAFEKIQQKSEKLCQQLTQARRGRQEVEDNKNELQALRGENFNLKKRIDQKDLALTGLRDQNGQQQKLIDEQKAEIQKLDQQVQLCGDQQLYRKFKEMVQMKDDLAQQLANRDFSFVSNQKSHDLVQQSYEQLKQGQLDLVEMNKKLIKDHQEDSQRVELQLKATQQKFEAKSAKLAKCQEIIQAFHTQIEMFEAFEKSSIKEMNMLQSQVSLYQDLFQKEKQEKEELVKRMRPSQRPLHDSVKKQMATQNQKTIDSNQDWEHKVQAFDSNKESLGGFNTKNSAEATKLKQTMSKNLSFGQPLQDSYQFGSNHNSGGNRHHQKFESNLPLQILNEASSDEGDHNVSRFSSHVNANNRKQDYNEQDRSRSGSRLMINKDSSAEYHNNINSNYQTPSNDIDEHARYSWKSRRSSSNHTSQTRATNPTNTYSSHNKVGLQQNTHHHNTNRSAVFPVEINNQNKAVGSMSAVQNQQRKLMSSNDGNKAMESQTAQKEQQLQQQQQQPIGYIKQQKMLGSNTNAMSSKDYYCRLKEMQRRLDKARSEIQTNVSRSHSRSKSPANYKPTIHQEPLIPDLKKIQPPASAVSCQSNYSQMNISQVSNYTNSLVSEKKEQIEPQNHHLKQFKNSNSQKNGMALQSDQRRDIPKPQQQQQQQQYQYSQSRSSKSRQHVASSHKNPDADSNLKHPQPSPLFYTSLYNGVQPLQK